MRLRAGYSSHDRVDRRSWQCVTRGSRAPLTVETVKHDGKQHPALTHDLRKRDLAALDICFRHMTGDGWPLTNLLLTQNDARKHENGSQSY